MRNGNAPPAVAHLHTPALADQDMLFLGDFMGSQTLDQKLGLMQDAGSALTGRLFLENGNDNLQLTRTAVSNPGETQ